MVMAVIAAYTLCCRRQVTEQIAPGDHDNTA